MENRRPLIAHFRAGIRGPVVIRGMSVRDLMMAAYRVRDFQISGGPSWLVTDRWNLETEADVSMDIPAVSSAPNTLGPLEIVYSQLLEDRFRLKIHRETKALPIYELVVARGGLKMKLSDDQTDPAPGPLPRPGGGIQPLTRGKYRLGRWRIVGKAVTWNEYFNLVFKNGILFDRDVLDRTNLNPRHRYDVKLEWMPNNPAVADAATPDSTFIFIALQEQLGLKLESARGPVEVLVIDSVNKPTEN